MELFFVILIIATVLAVIRMSPFGSRLWLFSKMAYLHSRKRGPDARALWRSRPFQEEVLPLFIDSFLIEEVSPYLAYLAYLRNKAIADLELSAGETAKFNEMIFEWLLSDRVFCSVSEWQENQEMPKEKLAFRALKEKWFWYFKTPH